jgi:prolyl-tRNA editing enzyme YbaK/EbsC (Cys-tRNA(Pro) deacylase)
MGVHVQVFANTQLAAQALATAINTNPASVFKTLIAKNLHGKATNVAILGPSAAPAVPGVWP